MHHSILGCRKRAERENLKLVKFVGSRHELLKFDGRCTAISRHCSRSILRDENEAIFQQNMLQIFSRAANADAALLKFDGRCTAFQGTAVDQYCGMRMKQIFSRICCRSSAELRMQQQLLRWRSMSIMAVRGLACMPVLGLSP